MGTIEAGASTDWEELLDGLIGPYELLAAHTEEALWGRVDYQRDGDPRRHSLLGVRGQAL
jgi:hypothetical protein